MISLVKMCVLLSHLESYCARSQQIFDVHVTLMGSMALASVLRIENWKFNQKIWSNQSHVFQFNYTLDDSLTLFQRQTERSDKPSTGIREPFIHILWGNIVRFFSLPFHFDTAWMGFRNLDRDSVAFSNREY